jgi:hypothetical protein
MLALNPYGQLARAITPPDEGQKAKSELADVRDAAPSCA